MFWALCDGSSGCGPLVVEMPRSTTRKYKGLYEVVFDGSGNIDQDRSVVYAGAVSTVIQWRALSEAWEDILAKNDLAYFKMAEANTLYGEFLNKPTEARDRIVVELARLRSRYSLGVVGAGYVIGTDKVAPFKPGESAADRKKQVFQGAVVAALRRIPPDYAIQVVCDVEKDIEERVRGWIDGVTKTESEKVGRVVGLSFLDDKYHQPVQFADMAAWVARTEIERAVHSPNQPPNPLYEMIFGNATTTLDRVEQGGLFRDFAIG